MGWPDVAAHRLLPHPVAWRDDVNVLFLQRISFGFKSPVGNVLRSTVGYLRTAAAAKLKASTAIGVMAATGKGVHVVKRPDQRDRRWDRAEETWVVGEK